MLDQFATKTLDEKCLYVKLLYRTRVEMLNTRCQFSILLYQCLMKTHRYLLYRACVLYIKQYLTRRRNLTRNSTISSLSTSIRIHSQPLFSLATVLMECRYFAIGDTCRKFRKRRPNVRPSVACWRAIRSHLQ